MTDALDQFRRISANLGKVSGERLAALQKEMNRIGYMLVGYIQTQKLQGQVLHKRGGKGSSNLSSHIDQRTTQLGDAVSTQVGVMRGVPYARIHEYGGEIHIPAVSGKLMAFAGDGGIVGQNLYDAPGSGGMVFTRKHRAYTVHMPERSYLRSSLRDKHDEIIERMQRAVSTGEAA